MTDLPAAERYIEDYLFEIPEENRSERLLFSPPRGPRSIEIPSIEIAESRIMSKLHQATETEMNDGLNWYFDARALCDEWGPRFGIKPEQVAGIIAALSPLRSWESNLQVAEMFLETGHCPTLSHARRTAEDIKSGMSPEKAIFKDEKNNPKVRAFYRNIAFPHDSDDATIDRHMWTMLLDDPTAVSKANLWFSADENEWAQGVFRSIARKLSVLPHQVQATTWVVQRRLRSETNGQMLLF